MDDDIMMKLWSRTKPD